MFMELFRNLSSQILIDLKELEGDYRTSNLFIDKAQTILYMLVVNIGGLIMLRVDWLFSRDRPGMFWQMVMYRGAFLLFTVVIIMAIGKTSAQFTPDNVRVWMAGRLVFENGLAVDFPKDILRKDLAAKEIEIRVHLGEGEADALARMRHKFPTGALAQLGFSVERIVRANSGHVPVPISIVEIRANPFLSGSG